jgi:hypothetical protein
MALPRGVIGVLETSFARLSRPILLPRGIAGAIEDAWFSVAGRPPEKRR